MRWPSVILIYSTLLPTALSTPLAPARKHSANKRQISGLHLSTPMPVTPDGDDLPLMTRPPHFFFFFDAVQTEEAIQPRQTLHPTKNPPPEPEDIVPRPNVNNTTDQGGHHHPLLHHGAIPHNKHHNKDVMPHMKRTQSSSSSSSSPGPSLYDANITATTTTTTTTPRNPIGSVAGCVTTTLGPLMNPCPPTSTDGGDGGGGFLLTSTVHTSTSTTFRSVNCHGCTSVHVIEPMWPCPMMETTTPLLAGAAGAAAAVVVVVVVTARTPLVWTSTVCERLTALAQLTETETVTHTETLTTSASASALTWTGSSSRSDSDEPQTITTVLTTVVQETEALTTTEVLWPTTSTVELPWLTLTTWHTKE